MDPIISKNSKSDLQIPSLQNFGRIFAGAESNNVILYFLSGRANFEMIFSGSVYRRLFVSPQSSSARSQRVQFLISKKSCVWSLPSQIGLRIFFGAARGGEGDTLCPVMRSFVLESIALSSSAVDGFSVNRVSQRAAVLAENQLNRSFG